MHGEMSGDMQMEMSMPFNKEQQPPSLRCSFETVRLLKGGGCVGADLPQV